MDSPLIWPRMSRNQAEEVFSEVHLDSGPKIELGTTQYDFDGIGARANRNDLLEIRDELLDIASQFGFKARHGYQQVSYPDRETARSIDRAFVTRFHDLTPMRWAEAGSREVWSWFALALLPDLTHWRWKAAVARKAGSREGEWYKPRWIGSDLTRHTWARYWWRAVQFEAAPELLMELNEHDLNHLLERADTLGANPGLMVSFGRQLLDLNEAFSGDDSVSRRDIFDDSTRRMLRRLAFVDDVALDEEEAQLLVGDFVNETKIRLSER